MIKSVKQLVLVMSIASCFLANGQSEENFTALHHWSVDTMVPSSKYKNAYNEVWGVVNKGVEYAVIGTTYGTHFLNVQDSSSFGEVAVVPGAFQGKKVIHRDYKHYKNYLYAVCDEGWGISTVQIIDYSYLPDSVHVVYDSKKPISTSHNIFIDTASAMAYMCGGYGVGVFSLERPDTLILIHHYKEASVHDLYVRNDTAYLNCGNEGLKIVDFSDPKSPNEIYALKDYPQKGYNHNGWLTGDGSTFVFADETWGTEVKVCDITEVNKLEIRSFIKPEGKDSSIAHNIYIKGDIAYISYYKDGLQVYDVSNRDAPTRVGYFNSGNNDTFSRYMGLWGVYPYLPSGKILISNMQNGLYVLEQYGNYPLNVKVPNVSSEVLVYPNPFESIIYLNSPIEFGPVKSLKLLDVLGREVEFSTLYNKTGVPISISLSQRPMSGAVLFLHVHFEDRTLVKRVFSK